MILKQRRFEFNARSAFFKSWCEAPWSEQSEDALRGAEQFGGAESTRRSRGGAKKSWCEAPWSEQSDDTLRKAKLV